MGRCLFDALQRPRVACCDAGSFSLQARISTLHEFVTKDNVEELMCGYATHQRRHTGRAAPTAQVSFSGVCAFKGSLRDRNLWRNVGTATMMQLYDNSEGDQIKRHRRRRRYGEGGLLGCAYQTVARGLLSDFRHCLAPLGLLFLCARGAQFV